MTKERILLAADRSNFGGFMSFIESSLNKDGIDNKTSMAILTASEEIIVNVVNYAYSGGGNLEIEYENNEERISITFIDEGVAFNPLEQPEVDTALPIDERREGGLGIFMVKNMMDDLVYKYEDKRNKLTIIKNIK